MEEDRNDQILLSPLKLVAAEHKTEMFLVRPGIVSRTCSIPKFEVLANEQV